MRGAVLHGLGLNLVKERLMRRSYGVTSHPVFAPDKHPASRRYVDVDGVERCKDAMDWYARRVHFCGRRGLISGRNNGKRSNRAPHFHR